jgi:hypothetical protein
MFRVQLYAIATAGSLVLLAPPSPVDAQRAAV